MTKPMLLCLHGWGGSKESFNNLRSALSDFDIDILTPDFPGFGDEPEPDKPWTVDDYAKWVEEESGLPAGQAGVRGQGSVMLLGHSFGGRVAIKLASRGNLKIDHIFLCASAGIYRPRQIKRTVGLVVVKAGKAFFSIPGLRFLSGLARKILYKILREHDYELASPRMQETHVRVVSEDLRPLLANITIPTDIFWGTADSMTPIADAYVMHNEIAGSALHVFQGEGHGVHRNHAKEIADVITANIQPE